MRVRQIHEGLPLGLCPLNNLDRYMCACLGDVYSVSAPFSLLSQSTKAIVEPDKTTAEFEVPHLAMGDSGFWECRVSTSGDQDSRRFKVNVKGQ